MSRWAGRSCLDLAGGILCSSSCVISQTPRVGSLASYAMFVLGGCSHTLRPSGFGSFLQLCDVSGTECLGSVPHAVTIGALPLWARHVVLGIGHSTARFSFPCILER